MTKEEQHEFLHDLAASIEHRLRKRLEEGHIPQQWNGHELRCLFAIAADQYAEPSDIRQSPHSKRARMFRKTLSVVGLP